jgi:CubicO group peptidase (beta-lactamase class C family)
MLNKKTLFILLLISIPALSCRVMASAFTSPQEPGAHLLASKVVDPITQSPKTNPNRGKAVYDWSALDRALESFVPDEVDGLTFILSKDGQILYEKALGNQTMNSFLPIASSTKMPSAVVILSLAQEGLLDLDEPISTYLQGHINWPSDKAAITTRMMLNHTSGLQSNPFCLNRRRGTLKECAQEIANAPLEFAPGTHFAYGGGSFQVAGYVAEAVGGNSWNDLFHERLATPLGLEKFTYSGGTLGSETNPRIAGGASSTAYDYIKILQMILSNRNYNPGVFVLSPEIIRMMSTSQIKGLPILRSPGEDYLLLGYSFGFWISDPSIHPGSNGPELSNPGAFGCTPWVDFDLGYTAVLLIKSSTRKGMDIWNTIRPSIIAELKAAK